MADNILKERYLDAREEAMKAGHQNYTFKMLQALRNMAEKDVYPDWRFGDEESGVWGMFHTFSIKKES